MMRALLLSVAVLALVNRSHSIALDANDEDDGGVEYTTVLIEDPNDLLKHPSPQAGTEKPHAQASGNLDEQVGQTAAMAAVRQLEEQEEATAAKGGKPAQAVATLTLSKDANHDPGAKGANSNEDDTDPQGVQSQRDPREGEAKAAMGECADNADSCAAWALDGFCDEKSQYYEHVAQKCPLSCKVCVPDSSQCKDENENCKFWKSKGYCTRHAGLDDTHVNYVVHHCKDSCGLCVTETSQKAEGNEDVAPALEDAGDIEAEGKRAVGQQPASCEGLKDEVAALVKRVEELETQVAAGNKAPVAAKPAHKAVAAWGEACGSDDGSYVCSSTLEGGCPDKGEDFFASERASGTRCQQPDHPGAAKVYCCKVVQKSPTAA